jgi:uncharacterized protein
MKALYITSTETFSGKSSLCVGLGRRFQQDGYSIGYIKPVSTTARRIEGKWQDEDAEFMKATFDLKESLEQLAPVCLEPFCIEDAIRTRVDHCELQAEDYTEKLEKTYAIVSEGKDIMILEGGSSLTEGSLIDLPPYHVCKMLQAPVMVVVKYTSDLVADEIIGAKRLLGQCMIGCVINAVPANRIEFVTETVKPFLEQRDIPVFGILPQERILNSISVGELAEALGGKVLCAEDAMDELVENMMVGAMSVESALTFFRRKLNKVVVTGGDRPDIQLAALETSTKCLILTGNLQPNPIILTRAEELGVPMILVGQDTMTAMRTIEGFFGKSRFHQRKKIARFDRVMAEHFDMEALYKALEMEPPA